MEERDKISFLQSSPLCDELLCGEIIKDFTLVSFMGSVVGHINHLLQLGQLLECKRQEKK